VQGLAAASRPVVFAQFHGEDVFAQLDPLEWQAAGIDRLVVRVFRNQSSQGGLFFQNPEFQVVKPLLADLIQRTRPKHDSIWAWMITRRFDWIGDSRLLDRSFQSGALQVIPSLDLFNPDAMKRVLAVFGQLAESGIKGIMIQDDLVIRSCEGLSSWGRAHYVLKTGNPSEMDSMLDPRSFAHSRWVDVKTRRVAEVLSQIVGICKQRNPDIRVGVNVYYETPLQAKKSREWYAHDLDLLLATGVDHVFLMAYHRQMAAELGLSAADAAELFSRMVARAAAKCKDKLVVKIQWRDWQSGEYVPEDELIGLLDRLPEQIHGVCLTPVALDDLPRLQKLLSRRGWSVGIRQGGG